MTFSIKQPNLFDFEQCLSFLRRSEQELLHTVSENYMYKAVKVNGKNILFRLFDAEEYLQVEWLVGDLTPKSKQFIHHYIQQMFDLKWDLQPFYDLAKTEPILQGLTKKYPGYRVIGIPDLFEALTWAIIGQQINLTFAYTLKKRFTQHFGEKVTWQGKDFWIFPEYSRIANLTKSDLQELQFSQRKAEYIIGVAQLMKHDKLCQKKLRQLDSKAMEKQLINIRGVGEWTANYVMMRTFNIASAFPVADVGLHRALEKQLNVTIRPTIYEIKQIAKQWAGWEAYATFYLWRSLYD